MEYKERIREFAASQGMSVAQLQKTLGLSNAHFQNSSRITPRVAALFRESFPQANVEWLNTGEGTMLLSQKAQDTADACYVPLLPVSAQGGSLSGFDCSVSGYECERIISPVREADIAIPVTGDSMAPEFPSGTIVFIKRIYEQMFIDWGHAFVLDTPNGVIIKKLLPVDGDESRVLCRSVNPQYPDFQVSRTDVRGWYRVLMSMTRK